MIVIIFRVIVIDHGQGRDASYLDSVSIWRCNVWQSSTGGGWPDQDHDTGADTKAQLDTISGSRKEMWTAMWHSHWLWGHLLTRVSYCLLSLILLCWQKKGSVKVFPALGSHNIRKSAKVVTMSLEGVPPASASDSLGVPSRPPL